MVPIFGLALSSRRHQTYVNRRVASFVASSEAMRRPIFACVGAKKKDNVALQLRREVLRRWMSKMLFFRWLLSPSVADGYCIRQA